MEYDESARMAAETVVRNHDADLWVPAEGQRFLAWHEPTRRWYEGYWRTPKIVGSALVVPWEASFFAPMPRPPTSAKLCNFLPITFQDWQNRSAQP